MKKLFLLFGFIKFAAVVASAQEIDRGERIRSLEIGYITKHVQLTPGEAEKFWPVFNKYRQELKAVAVDNSIKEELDRQQKVLDIRKKYKKDFTAILNADRAQQVFEAEDRFKVLVKKELQKRARARQGGGDAEKSGNNK
ncbi:MAG: hypothetical protein KF746_01645 [Chitinophagaceae bacterium]|nr:hypothetical protein [Chitinophagaceae bacterium]